MRGSRHADVGGQLDLQLKSTTRAELSNSEVLFDLERKTYDDLRVPGDNVPRILVVLLMPVDEGLWISQSPEELLLRRGAYWASLEGCPSTGAAKTVRIKIPRSNVFSVESVLGLMVRLRERKNE
jgi:hypothetical protein